MRILFSCVGGSDPITNFLDGPMLHCCRVYQPDVVYLYFTKEMLETENKDHRYTWAIEKLGKELKHEFKIEKIERLECTEPNIFDTFFDDFDHCFDKMEKEYPEAEIYANASSGTPAMKSAIVIIASMSVKKINVIQVSSGEKSTVHRPHVDSSDLQALWDTNGDNEDMKDRTILIQSRNFKVKIKKENIRRFINAYDYSAAALLAEDIKENISKEAFEMIKMAENRYLLKNKAFRKYSLYTPVTEEIEYILWLGITLKRKDYLNFMRGITPAAQKLMEKAFSNMVGDMKKYCYENEKNKGSYTWACKKLEETDMGMKILDILKVKFPNFEERPCSTIHLNTVIQAMSDDETLKGYAKEIREAEEKIRNPAAHTIISIDPQFIKDKINISVDKLYCDMKRMAEKLCHVNKEAWNSYERMNEIILEKLGK